MLTQCPACLTIFRVTGPILRMGHGQVRCGRCEQQFDALERLLDDDEEAMQTGEMRALKRTLGEPPPVAETISIQTKTEVELLEDTPVATDAPKSHTPNLDITALQEPEMPSPAELPVGTSTIVGEQAVGAASWGTDTVVPGPLSNPATDPVDELSALRDDINEPEPITTALSEREELELLSGQRRRHNARQERRGLWTGLSLAFALVLLLQIVHHYRQDLVRHPRLGSVMTRIYGALGIPLEQAWDLTAYEIQQWGATSDPSVPGTLRVRATIGNVAGFAQPYPVLRFVLEDRWGDAVGSRDFAPQEYLEPGTPVDRLLSPNQRATVDVAIIDPGQDAVGFRWSICLPQPEGMQCESDIAHS